MTWTLSRYIGARYLAALTWSMLIVLAIIVIGNAIEGLRDAGDEVGLGVVLSIAALRAPVIALTALPFVVMLAALACFARLARSSELVVTRAAGVSVWTLIAPVTLISALVGLAGTTVLNPGAAYSQARADAMEARYIDGATSPLSLSREGVWLRQGEGGRQRVIHARAIDAGPMTLRDVTIFDFTDEGAVRGRLDAATAQLRPGAWLLGDGVARSFDAEATGAPDETPFETREVPTELTRAQIIDSFDRPEAISFWRLPAFIETLEEAGFSALRHRMHWQAQLAAPLLFFGMAMVGSAFSMRHVRFGGLGMMGLAAVLAGFTLFFVTDVAKALGASGAIPPMLAAWAPPLATVLAATALLLHLEDG
jgi:lipopolysaccharide export system permease protein